MCKTSAQKSHFSSICSGSQAPSTTCAAVFLTLSSHLVPKTLSKYSLPSEESYLIEADKYNEESPVICGYVKDHGSVTVTV